MFQAEFILRVYIGREKGRNEMCKWGINSLIFVKIPADLSSTGMEKWRYMGIDSCIADIVQALQNGGIDMRGSCCGHHKYWGDIHLQDDRVLLIVNGDEYYKKRLSLLFKMFIKQLLWQCKISMRNYWKSLTKWCEVIKKLESRIFYIWG